MLPYFNLMCYPLTVDHVMSKDAPICSLCGELYTVKPKDHGFVQINEMTEKKRKLNFLST
jgi:hypothetical protein